MQRNRSRSTQGPGGKWLLLIHQIPPKPDYFRVKVRRRLHSLGAVALKNSVYVLPENDETMEDLQWLRRMVVDEGGEATICSASFVEGVSDRELEAMFRARSEEEFAEIVTAARTDATEADLRRLERRLASAGRRDFFLADRREEAERAVREAQLARSGPSADEGDVANGSESIRPSAATWVTRTGVMADRMASAWLIRRFIDDKASFKFVGARGYVPEPGELRFDMYEGEYTHEGDNCTFEVLVGRFVPDDEALRAIAEIVHDVDCKDEKFDRDEAPGVAAVLLGIATSHDDDTARLEAARELFDGLYAACRAHAR